MQIPINFETGIQKEEENTEEVSLPQTSETGMEKPREDASSSVETAYLRLKADYENLKKRLHKEMTQRVDYELGAFFKDFLTSYDDLERALPFCRSDSPVSGNEELFEGICLIHKRLGDLLEKSGLERMETLGKPFDPRYHEAIIMEAHPEAKSNTIVGEIEPGYLFRGNLLRPAKVKVAQ